MCNHTGLLKTNAGHTAGDQHKEEVPGCGCIMFFHVLLRPPSLNESIVANTSSFFKLQSSNPVNETMALADKLEFFMGATQIPNSGPQPIKRGNKQAFQ